MYASIDTSVARGARRAPAAGRGAGGEKTALRPLIWWSES